MKSSAESEAPGPDDPAERQPVPWQELNDTASELPRHRCLHESFERRAAEQPDQIAIVDAEGSVDYASLERRANRLAHYLQENAVGPDVPVGICLGSGRARAAAILGVLKAGGCYLPLAPDYPADRLIYMLEGVRAPLVLTEEALVEGLPSEATRILSLDREAVAIEDRPATRPHSRVEPENLAYVIYTSGSTGKPKPIAVCHRGVSNNLHDLGGRFSIGPPDRCLAISSLSFDMCVFEILGLLGAGGTVVMPAPDEVREPSRWLQLIRRHRITLWNSAPALLEMLVESAEPRSEAALETLRLALLGGDWIPVSLPDRLRRLAPSARVVSLGGATEASIHSTIYQVGSVDPAWPSIPYGRPMANQVTYVVDETMRLVDIGEPGELYIGGVGLAHGYLGRPDLTAERFLPDPFSGVPGQRIYRTGDLVRYRSDGNLELLGRVDFQVKIRGHRIELREIESALLAHDAVADAVVTGIGQGSDRRLVAYAVPDRGAPASDESVRSELEQWRTIYEETYGADEPTPSARDFAGWVSSLTEEPFTRAELDEVVDTTLARLRAFSPRAVLEIGCGTGLLLFDLAPDCERYDASDFSVRALESVQRRLSRRTDARLDHVRLERRSADDMQEVDQEAYDLVLINSVTQHFPSMEYAVRVLEGALGATAPGGRIFLGDVRCLPLLRAFHTAIELDRSEPDTPLVEVKHRVDRRLRREKELWIDPEFFAEFLDRHPQLASAEVLLRRGVHWNEMNVFHHDVVLRKGGAETEPTPSWREISWDRGGVQAIPTEAIPGTADEAGIVLRGIPDSRTSEVVAAARLVDEPGELATVRELRRHLEASPTGAPTPNELWQLERQLGLDVVLTWPASGRPGTFDAKFLPAQAAAEEPQQEDRSNHEPHDHEPHDHEPHNHEPHNHELSPERPGTADPSSWEMFGNRNQGFWSTGLVAELRQHLSRTLPDFMVPSEFVLLEALPLSPNGKVDRRALPRPETVRDSNESDRREPSTPTEQLIALLWSEVLGASRIDAESDFFELGGHSLSATQLTSRLRDLVSLEVPIAAVFEHPTLSTFASHVAALAGSAGIDLEEVATIALEVSRLSDDEVHRALQEENA